MIEDALLDVEAILKTRPLSSDPAGPDPTMESTPPAANDHAVGPDDCPPSHQTSQGASEELGNSLASSGDVETPISSASVSHCLAGPQAQRTDSGAAAADDSSPEVRRCLTFSDVVEISDSDRQVLRDSVRSETAEFESTLGLDQYSRFSGGGTSLKESIRQHTLATGAAVSLQEEVASVDIISRRVEHTYRSSFQLPDDSIVAVTHQEVYHSTEPDVHVTVTIARAAPEGPVESLVGPTLAELARSNHWAGLMLSSDGYYDDQLCSMLLRCRRPDNVESAADVREPEEVDASEVSARQQLAGALAAARVISASLDHLAVTRTRSSAASRPINDRLPPPAETRSEADLASAAVTQAEHEPPTLLSQAASSSLGYQSHSSLYSSVSRASRKLSMSDRVYLEVLSGDSQLGSDDESATAAERFSSVVDEPHGRAADATPAGLEPSPPPPPRRLSLTVADFLSMESFEMQQVAIQGDDRDTIDVEAAANPPPAVYARYPHEMGLSASVPTVTHAVVSAHSVAATPAIVSVLDSTSITDSTPAADSTPISDVNLISAPASFPTVEKKEKDETTAVVEDAFDEVKVATASIHSKPPVSCSRGTVDPVEQVDGGGSCSPYGLVRQRAKAFEEEEEALRRRFMSQTAAERRSYQELQDSGAVSEGTELHEDYIRRHAMPPEPGNFHLDVPTEDQERILFQHRLNEIMAEGAPQCPQPATTAAPSAASVVHRAQEDLTWRLPVTGPLDIAFIESESDSGESSGGEQVSPSLPTSTLICPTGPASSALATITEEPQAQLPVQEAQLGEIAGRQSDLTNQPSVLMRPTPGAPISQPEEEDDDFHDATQSDVGEGLAIVLAVSSASDNLAIFVSVAAPEPILMDPSLVESAVSQLAQQERVLIVAPPRVQENCTLVTSVAAVAAGLKPDPDASVIAEAEAVPRPALSPPPVGKSVMQTADIDDRKQPKPGPDGGRLTEHRQKSVRKSSFRSTARKAGKSKDPDEAQIAQLNKSDEEPPLSVVPVEDSIQKLSFDDYASQMLQSRHCDTEVAVAEAQLPVAAELHKSPLGGGALQPEPPTLQLIAFAMPAAVLKQSIQPPLTAVSGFDAIPIVDSASLVCTRPKRLSSHVLTGQKFISRKTSSKRKNRRTDDQKPSSVGTKSTDHRQQSIRSPFRSVNKKADMSREQAAVIGDGSEALAKLASENSASEPMPVTIEDNIEVLSYDEYCKMLLSARARDAEALDAEAQPPVADQLCLHRSPVGADGQSPPSVLPSPTQLVAFAAPAAAVKQAVRLSPAAEVGDAILCSECTSARPSRLCSHTSTGQSLVSPKPASNEKNERRTGDKKSTEHRQKSLRKSSFRSTARKEDKSETAADDESKAQINQLDKQEEQSHMTIVSIEDNIPALSYGAYAEQMLRPNRDAETVEAEAQPPFVEHVSLHRSPVANCESPPPSPQLVAFAAPAAAVKQAVRLSPAEVPAEVGDALLCSECTSQALARPNRLCSHTSTGRSLVSPKPASKKKESRTGDKKSTEHRQKSLRKSSFRSTARKADKPAIAPADESKAQINQPDKQEEQSPMTIVSIEDNIPELSYGAYAEQMLRPNRDTDTAEAEAQPSLAEMSLHRFPAVADEEGSFRPPPELVAFATPASALKQAVHLPAAAASLDDAIPVVSSTSMVPERPAHLGSLVAPDEPPPLPPTPPTASAGSPRIRRSKLSGGSGSRRRSSRWSSKPQAPAKSSAKDALNISVNEGSDENRGQVAAPWPRFSRRRSSLRSEKASKSLGPKSPPAVSPSFPGLNTKGETEPNNPDFQRQETGTFLVAPPADTEPNDKNSLPLSQPTTESPHDSAVTVTSVSPSPSPSPSTSPPVSDTGVVVNLLAASESSSSGAGTDEDEDESDDEEEAEDDEGSRKASLPVPDRDRQRSKQPAPQAPQQLRTETDPFGAGAIDFLLACLNRRQLPPGVGGETALHPNPYQGLQASAAAAPSKTADDRRRSYRRRVKREQRRERRLRQRQLSGGAGGGAGPSGAAGGSVSRTGSYYRHSSSALSLQREPSYLALLKSRSRSRSPDLADRSKSYTAYYSENDLDDEFRLSGGEADDVVRRRAGSADPLSSSPQARARLSLQQQRQLEQRLRAARSMPIPGAGDYNELAFQVLTPSRRRSRRRRLLHGLPDASSTVNLVYETSL